MTKSDLFTILAESRIRTNGRKLLELVYVNGMTQADAARIVGVSRTAASEYMSRFKLLLDKGKRETL